MTNEWSVADLRRFAERAADELLGTSRSLHELSMEDASSSSVFVARLDELAICCGGCEWWCPPDEMSDSAGGDFVCEDCNEIPNQNG